MTPAEILAKLKRMQAADVLARLVWAEARGETIKGQVAVACVVVNRVADGRFGKGIVGVSLRRWQFSCFNTNDPNLPRLLYPPESEVFEQCKVVARLAVDGLLLDLTKGATHYFNPGAVKGGWPSSWDKSKMVDHGRIGRHWFWREMK